MSKAYTGSFAPQFNNGATRMVANLSLGSLSVRVAITPGDSAAASYASRHHEREYRRAVKPEPFERPIQQNATRAIYPVSSSMAMAKNMNAISGTNPITPRRRR